ncbi:MAG: hypothetical protein ONB17_04560, partial [candidate division KSB1 bacterium]|nr:hypothetical protein [candidate division KSB1 bacterium]
EPYVSAPFAEADRFVVTLSQGGLALNPVFAGKTYNQLLGHRLHVHCFLIRSISFSTSASSFSKSSLYDLSHSNRSSLLGRNQPQGPQQHPVIG